MKRFARAAAGAALFGSALLLPPAASDAQSSATDVPGYFDPASGEFTARPALVPAKAGLQRSGTIIVTITAVLGSNISASATLTCGVGISTFDNSFTNSGNASGTVKRSGKGGTCKVSVPYIFEVAGASTTMSVTATLFASTNTNPALSYGASHSFSFPVPSGNKALAVTLAM